MVARQAACCRGLRFVREILRLRAKEVDCSLLGKIDLLVPIPRISVDELIIYIVQASRGECHCIFDILVENVGIVIGATCEFKARKDGGTRGRRVVGWCW